MFTHLISFQNLKNIVFNENASTYKMMKKYRIYTFSRSLDVFYWSEGCFITTQKRSKSF